MDLGIEVILKLFSKKGGADMFLFSEENSNPKSENIQRIRSLKHEYIKTIEVTIAFLQGKNPT